MNAVRQENKKLSVNIEKILFSCDEYNPSLENSRTISKKKTTKIKKELVR